MLLVVNDHVLKGSGTIPAIATGKLSDVAGLIVAPLVLARLMSGGRCSSPVRTGLAFLIVGVTFVLINLSQSIADNVADVPRSFGIPSRLWADPTDLLALLVLPLAWKVCPHRQRCTTSMESRRSSIWGHELARRIGVVAGGVACLATSSHEERIRTAAYLYNMTRHDLKVDIRPVGESVECEQLEEGPFSQLTAETFEDGACESVKPYETLQLDPHAVVDGEDEKPESPEHCDAAVVRIGGAAPSLFIWRSAPRTILQGNDYDEILVDPHSVLVEELGDERHFAPGEHVRVMALTDGDIASLPACEADE